MSLIKLYKNCDILPNKNFEVDDIAEYLSTKYPLAGAVKGRMEIDKCQWTKHQLELTYKLQLSQYDIEFNQDDNWNYMSVQNASGGFINPTKIVYYFIINKKWISSECIEFTLKMDVLNTFKGDYTLSPKTTILRQHKDRWERTGQVGSEEFKPIVDLYSENIQPILFKKKEDTLYQKLDNGDHDTNRWYLLYRESSTDGPIKIYLCADQTLYTNAYTKFTGEVNASGGTNAYRIVIGSEAYGGRDNVGASITFNFNEQEYTFTINNTNEVLIFSDEFVIKGHWGDYDSSHQNVIIVSSVVAPRRSKRFDKFYLENINSVHIPQFPTINPRTNTTQRTYINAHPSDFLNTAFYTPWMGQETSRKIDSINEVDLSDPLFVKVVCFPYCPFNLQLTIHDTEYSIGNLGELVPAEYKADHYLYEYTQRDNISVITNEELLMCNEDGEYVSPYFKTQWRNLNDLGKQIAKNKDYEVKLLHSDYFQQKLVYDNFAYIFRCEFIKPTQSNALFLKQITSTALSSKFMFEIPYAFEGMKTDIEDYSGYISVNRNNEVPLYNSAFLNYIRMGYNFDVKTRNRQLTSSVIGTSLSIAGGIGSLLSSAFTGGIGITAGIGLITAGIGGVYKTISNTAQADQNIAEKMRQSEMQGVAVNGADDIDTLTYYTNGNKLKFIEYKCSEKMENALFDMFHYYGYIGNFQDVPNLTSRALFNYVQAEIVFATTTNFPKEISDEIVNKYKEGMTRIHHYTLSNDLGTRIRGWDFEQQYENWETSLL